MAQFGILKMCPLCGIPVQGRADKMYCSTACRIEYHNEQHRSEHHLFRATNNKLRKNRKILYEHYVSGKTQIEKIKLEREGFDFELITKLCKLENNKPNLRLCYDMAYQYISDEIVSLIRMENGVIKLST